MTITSNTSSLRDHLANLGNQTPATPAPSAPVAPQFNRTPSAPRPNKFAGKCTQCSQWVEAGAGLLGGSKAAGWSVKHSECPAAAAVTAAAPVVNTRDGDPYPGLYTVELPTGHDTFRVKVQADDADFLPGRTLVEVLDGPDNTYNYHTLGSFVNGQLRLFKKNAIGGSWSEALAIFLADPESVLEAKNCILCNRVLTTPESIAAGIGPDCAKRV